MHPSNNTERLVIPNRKWTSFTTKQRIHITWQVFTLVFVLVSSMIIEANCDHKRGDLFESFKYEKPTKLVGAVRSQRVSRKHEVTGAYKNLVKNDPLSLLREIYLDYNNKLLTLVSLEPIGESVQKFHPNGRYGRRSINNAEPNSHFQFGKLSVPRFPGVNRVPIHQLNEEEEIIRELLGSLNHANSAKDRSTKRATAQIQLPDSVSDADASIINLQSEISKLLKCHYTGVSNIYRCDN